MNDDIESGHVKPKPAWGKYWEIIYDPAGVNFTAAQFSLEELNNSEGHTQCLVETNGEPHGVNLKDKRFRKCDFNNFCVKNSSFTNFEFVDCRFVKAHFKNVKFRGCQFRRCHFLHAEFFRCHFMDCSFSEITASAKDIGFQATEIPAPNFLDSLTTNLVHLPDGRTKEHQLHRLAKTKLDLASIILGSNREADHRELTHESLRQHEVLWREWRILDSRYSAEDGVLVKRKGFASRWRRFTASIELQLIKIAGFLTDWGRSPSISILLIVPILLFFAILYSFLVPDKTGWEIVEASLVRAIDITLVAGYTKYTASASPVLQFIQISNLCIGLLWYSLLIPTLVTATIRPVR